MDRSLRLSLPQLSFIHMYQGLRIRTGTGSEPELQRSEPELQRSEPELDPNRKWIRTGTGFKPELQIRAGSGFYPELDPSIQSTDLD